MYEIRVIAFAALKSLIRRPLSAGVGKCQVYTIILSNL